MVRPYFYRIVGDCSRRITSSRLLNPDVFLYNQLMSLGVGIVGLPNAEKSTLFSEPGVGSKYFDI